MSIGPPPMMGDRQDRERPLRLVEDGGKSVTIDGHPAIVTPTSMQRASLRTPASAILDSFPRPADIRSIWIR